MLPGSLGAFAGTYLSAGIILLASLLVGRALLLTLGRRRCFVPGGAVGSRGPDPGLHGRDPAAGRRRHLAGDLRDRWWSPRSAFLVARRRGDPRPGRRPRAAGRLCSPACSPRCPSSPAATSASRESASTTTWRCTWSTPTTCSTRHGPQPQSIVNGYPIGPAQPGRHGGQPARHRAAAGLARAAGRRPGAHRRSPRLRRAAGAAGLAAHPGAPCSSRLAYLTASVLGIAGFKELIAGMFLIAFALGLREIERSPDGRIAIVIGLALITAAMVPVYSLPGVAWLVITAGLWLRRPSAPDPGGERPGRRPGRWCAPRCRS